MKLRRPMLGLVGLFLVVTTALTLAASLTGCSCDDTNPKNDCIYPDVNAIQ